MVLEKVESGFNNLERFNVICAQTIIRRMKM